MGQLSSTAKQYKDKKEVQNKQYLNEITDSKQPSVQVFTHRPQQSQGETNQQDLSFSQMYQEIDFKIDQKEHQNQEIISIIGSHQQYQIDAGGNFFRSLEDINPIQMCIYCNVQIEETSIRVICNHIFHNGCFVNLIEQQLLQVDRRIIQCICGTKLNPNLLRHIVNQEARSKLLYQVFSKQIQIILNNSLIREKPDYEKIVQLFQSNKKQQDFQLLQFDQQNNDQQITIQETQFKSNGILQLNESKIISINLCQLCQNQIHNDLIKLNCNHSYHSKCFKEWLESSIMDRTKNILKCICGSKLSTNIIRTIPDFPQRMQLLNNLFSTQLIQVLKLLKKKADFIQIMDIFHRYQNTEDQDYLSLSGVIYQSHSSTPGGE